MEKFRVCIIRVSTNKQRTEIQRQGLAEVIASIENPEHIIEDVVSGRKKNRPTFTKILGWVKAGWVKEIVCWRYDRLGRNFGEMVTLADACKTTNTDIWSVSQNMRLSGPLGHVMFAILGALAEWEVEQITERTKDGMKNAKAKNKIVGMTGLRYVRKKTMNIAPMVLQYRAEGYSINKLADMFACNTKTINKILRTPEHSLKSLEQVLEDVPDERRGKRFHGEY